MADGSRFKARDFVHVDRIRQRATVTNGSSERSLLSLTRLNQTEIQAPDKASAADEGIEVWGECGEFGFTGRSWRLIRSPVD